MLLIQLDPYITKSNKDNLLFDYSSNFTKRNNLYWNRLVLNGVRTYLITLAFYSIRKRSIMKGILETNWLF